MFEQEFGDIDYTENVDKIDRFEEQENHHVKGYEDVIAQYAPNKIASIEAYSPLFPTFIRLGRLFRMKVSSSEYNPSMIMLRQFSNVAFVPLVRSPEDVMNEVQLCFGSKMYSRMVMDYVIPKRFRYKNPYIPGSKMTVKFVDMNAYSDNLKRVLPAYKSLPTPYIKNLKNTTFDFSTLLNMCWPSMLMCSRPNIMPISETIILQIISRLIFGRDGKTDNIHPLFSNYDGVCGVPGQYFDSIIISVPLETKDSRIGNIYIDPKSGKVPNSIKKSPEDSVAYGALRFVLDLIDDRQFEDSPLKNRLAECIKQKQHVIFLFHNNTHGFYVDYAEIKEKEFKFDNIYRLIKTSVKAIIALNNSEVNAVDIQEAINDNVSDEDAEKNVDSKIRLNTNFTEKVSDGISAKTDIDISKDSIEKTLPEFKKLDSPEDKKDLAEQALLLKAQLNIKAKAKLGFSNDEPDVEEDPTSVTDVDLNKIGKDEDEDDTSASSTNEDSTDIDMSDLPSEEGIDQEEADDTAKNLEDAADFVKDMEAENSEAMKQKLIKEAAKAAAPKLSLKEQQRLEKLHDKYKSIKFDDNKTMDEVLKNAEAMTIDITKNNVDIKDSSYNYNMLRDMTNSYVNKTMAHDMVSIVKSLSEDKSINMNITDFKKKDVSDQFNKLELYTFNLEDDTKHAHKIQFKMPKVDDAGFMYINGNRKYLKKEWILKPVTKTSTDDVYLVSNYNKTHIFRQGKILNKNTVILKKLITSFLANPDKYGKVVSISRGDDSVTNGDYITSIEYDDLGSFMHRLSILPETHNETEFFFSQKDIRETIKEYNIDYTPVGTKIPIGIIKATKEIIEVDSLDSTDSVSDKILKVIKDSNIVQDFDTFVKVTTIPRRKMYTRIELLSQPVPLIVFLSALFTFTKVIETGKIETIFIPLKGKKTQELVDHPELYTFIKFADGWLYYKQYPIENALLLNGLAELNVDVVNFSDLDNLGTYLDYVYDTLKTRNLYKGWTAFKELFIDPITKDVLEQLHEPTDFLELFLYANSLLADNNHTMSTDISNYRIRDYEMLNSYLYSSIATSYRAYKQRGNTRESFSIPEDDVLKQINKSLVIANYDDTNPLNEIRNKSTITFKGPEGINTDRAFSIAKRGQTRSAVGTVGITFVENGNVGIVKQLTLNPRVISTRGFIDTPVTDKDVDSIPSSSLMTAEESALPYINRDDPKRIGFASVQTSHVIPAKGFDCPMVGTGFDQAVIHDISDDFGYKAKHNGTVVEVDDKDKFAVIKYDDGSFDRIEYGFRYNRNSDFFLSNNLALNVKKGDNVKQGEIITYNEDFFKNHLGKLIFTQGAISRVAIMEGEVTEEDSSAISSDLAYKLTGTVIKRKQIVTGYNANISKVAKIGDYVRYGDPLVIYEDQKDADADMSLLSLLGQTNDSVLDNLTRHSGEANYSGTIIDMKVYWSVDPELMGESCRKFVKQYQNTLKQQISIEEKASGQKSSRRIELEVSKPIGNDNRINGMKIPEDGGILIEFYIGHTASKRPGDKISLNTSLKSVITQVIPKELTPKRLSKSKFNDIACIFSLLSIDARMVSSVWYTGYLSKVLFEYGKATAEEYLKESKS